MEFLIALLQFAAFIAGVLVVCGAFGLGVKKLLDAIFIGKEATEEEATEQWNTLTKYEDIRQAGIVDAKVNLLCTKFKIAAEKKVVKEQEKEEHKRLKQAIRTQGLPTDFDKAMSNYGIEDPELKERIRQEASK